MKKIFINIPKYGIDREDTEKTIRIIKNICGDIYLNDTVKVIDFMIPSYDEIDSMDGFIDALKLMNECVVYVKLDSGDVYDDLYFALENAYNIYKDEFELLDLSRLTKQIAPQLYD